MSQHIIKCKTILKVNEIETINLTLALNFHGEPHRDMGTHAYKWLVGTGHGTGVVGPAVLVLPCGVTEGLCSPPPHPCSCQISQVQTRVGNATWSMLHGTMPGNGTRSTADMEQDEADGRGTFLGHLPCQQRCPVQRPHFTHKPPLGTPNPPVGSSLR